MCDFSREVDDVSADISWMLMSVQNPVYLVLFESKIICTMATWSYFSKLISVWLAIASMPPCYGSKKIYILWVKYFLQHFIDFSI